MDSVIEDVTEKRLVLKLKALMREIGRNYNVDILSDSRKRENVLPRQVMMAILHKELNVTLALVGKVFGKNHATIIHSIKCWNNSMGLKDPSSRAMQEHYNNFLPYVKQFRRKLIDRQKEVGQLILEDTEIIEQRIAKMERKMDEQMLFIAKIAEKNSRMSSRLAEERKQKEEYREKYTKLKRDWELLAPSREEEVELERLKTYI
jgi:hypothetical protein